MFKSCQFKNILNNSSTSNLLPVMSDSIKRDKSKYLMSNFINCIVYFQVQYSLSDHWNDLFWTQQFNVLALIVIINRYQTRPRSKVSKRLWTTGQKNLKTKMTTTLRQSDNSRISKCTVLYIPILLNALYQFCNIVQTKIVTLQTFKTMFQYKLGH